MSQQVVIQQPLTQVLIPPGNKSPGSQASQSSSSQSSIPTLKVTQPVAGPSGIKNAPLTQYQISPTPYSVVSLGQSQHETSDEQPKTVVLESIPSQAMQQEIEPIYCSENGIIYLTNTEEQQSNLENHVLTDNDGAITYADLKKDLQQFIQNSVKAAVEECFQTHFTRMTALVEMQARSTTTTSEPSDHPVEQHARINNEVELHDWNVKLRNEELCSQYLQYFTRIIPPNSYESNGNNACYTIVDCLFTRDFWNNFTWTGISRGETSKRGFREFGNILQLLLKLVRIGDPTYTAQKLEVFCRTRLFRYSKSRCTNQRLRKSSCRPTRKRKEIIKKKIDNLNDMTHHEEEPNDSSDHTEPFNNSQGEMDPDTTFEHDADIELDDADDQMETNEVSLE
ncbi:uncharacterized protein LOC134206161 [Armigeres subalbatus]|uniref:uncharacterized protein LOC134206161 n=1 Tax=Armigeres subalbatus TaxID=124917 RepID=UPI002ED35732